MSFEDFKSSLEGEVPPTSISPLLEALWFDGNRDWKQAHEITQHINTPDGSWVHAYLHRKEGDLSNAEYWYVKARKEMPNLSLFEEWEEIVFELLSRQ